MSRSIQSLCKKNTCLVILLIFLAGSVCQAFAGEKFALDKAALDKAEQLYGPEARRRLLDWQDMINYDSSRTVAEKLKKVNDFINQFDFVSDQNHWGQEDYWATPVEFIASRGGDCEDFSVAKYFTLKAMGVPERKLSITYVKALSQDETHMVTTYIERTGAEPLVLDNLVTDILPISQRPDLLPVYSFNDTWLWAATRKGRGKVVGKSDELAQWKDLLKRMEKGLI